MLKRYSPERPSVREFSAAPGTAAVQLYFRARHDCVVMLYEPQLGVERFIAERFVRVPPGGERLVGPVTFALPPCGAERKFKAVIYSHGTE